MLRGFRRGTLLILTGLLLAAPLLTTFTPSIASAAQANPQDQLERWLYYRGMRACLDNPDFDHIKPIDDNGDRSSGDINEGHILPGGASSQPKRGFGYLAPGMDGGNDNDGTVSCTDGSIFVRGATLFGFDNVVHLVCAMNRALPSSENGRIEPSDAADCEASTEFHFDGGGGSVFQQALTKALSDEGSKDRPSFNINDNNNAAGPYSYKALLYLIGKNSLEVFCGNGRSLAEATGGDISDDDVVSVDIVTLVEGEIELLESKPYPLGNPDRNEDSKVDDVYYNQGGDSNNAQDLRCHEMAKMTRDNSTAYRDWAKVNKDAFEENETETDTGTDPGSGGAGTTCAIDGIGWIVCPVMVFLAEINDQAFGFLTKLLDVSPKLVQDEGTLSAWSTFRDFANVAFVIAFMVIVYSQLTSAGIANYGVKKMLPKIVIAAILVNVSYFICAIMVDLSNIVGSSIYQLFISIGGDATSGAGTDGSTWSSIVGGLLMAGVVAALIVALILAPTALLALALIVMILVARQALVLILIIASPLAFVAYLLPNTEDWFKKWWKAFVAVLMVYPIVGMVFGASNMISNILMGIAGDGGGGDDENLLKIVALAVLAIPLFAVPAILKGSLSAMGSIGTRLQGFADKSQGFASRQGKRRFDDTAFMRGRKLRNDAKGQFKSKRFAEGVSGQDVSLMGRARRRASMGVTGRTYTNAGDYAREHMATAALSHALTAEDKEYEENVKGAALQQVGLTNAETAAITKTGMINGRKASQYEMAAANDRIMKSGSFDERREALEYLAANKSDPEHGSRSLRNRAVQGAYSRGDGNIYGAGFGNEVVSETGRIDGAEGLMKETVANAKSNKVSAAHAVQGEASAKYLVSAVTDGTHGDASARANVKAAAAKAKADPSTSGSYTGSMDSHFSTL